MNPAAPEIAILTPAILTALGLRSILEKFIPEASVTVFDRTEDLVEAAPERYFHLFVSVRLYLEHPEAFDAAGHRTILLCNGTPPLQLKGRPCLNIAQGEAEIIRDLVRLHHTAHRHGHPGHPAAPPPAPDELTPRERQVLLLAVRGLRNKEIAARLGIGLTTVISHRRNIADKTQARTLAALTIWAVGRGYVDPEHL